MTKRKGIKLLRDNFSILAAALGGAVLLLVLTFHTSPVVAISKSSEIGFTSLSPRGTAGGSIIPASCESGLGEGGVEHFAGDTSGNCYAGNICAPNPDPPGYGTSCASSANSCGQTQANGTVQCNGSCSSTPPAPPAGFGNSCSSASNACGQTQSNGTIQCNGSCSSTPPANPLGFGNPCSSAANSCGQTQANGTIQCNGSCSSTPPPDSGCPPTPSLDASPDRVSNGGTTTVTWDATNVDSCTITKNGASWPGHTFTADASHHIFGSTLDTITSQTVYVITCTNASGAVVTKSKVVNIVSAFQEF